MHKQILKLAIPNIISNITIPLSASIDTALMGHLSAKHLGAIALGSMIFTFLYGSFNFLRMGTTGMVAQSYGRADQKEVTLILYRALILALFISLLVVIFQKPILHLAIVALNGDELSSLISEYFDVRVYAVFGAMINFVLIGWYFGVSNSIIPLIMTATVNLSNAFLSYILVYHFDMGIKGVALGTLISQYLGVMVGVYYLKEYFLQKVTIGEVLNKEKLLRFFSINRDIFIRTIALTGVLSIFYSLAAKNSSLTLAVATVVMQFMAWMAYAIDGFANASESLVGKYYGMQNRQKMFKAIKLSMLYGFYLSLFFGIFYLSFVKELTSFFTSDISVIKEMKELRWYLFIVPVVSFTAFIFDGIYVGMTKTKVLRDSVLIGSIGFLGIFYLFKDFDYEFWLFSSFLLFFAIRGLYEIGWFVNGL